ncbi:hypothetical protein BJ742DRAFT_777955 [Cladochytrium replicatum]|nr:hypothetical protein BJ742DRAFT_777955 [Cladochytrium replicatum]
MDLRLRTRKGKTPATARVAPSPELDNPRKPQKRVFRKKPEINVESENTSRINILDLSNEVLDMILTRISDVSTLSTFIKTCKRINSHVNPSTSSGQHFWSRLRIAHKWPDPNPIGLSDFEFLKAYYGRGCCNCTKRPRTRTPRWAFGGIRICDFCLGKVLIRRSELRKQKIPKDRYEFLPCVELSIQGYPIRMFHRSSILDHSPSDGAIEAMKAHLVHLEQFEKQFNEAVTEHLDWKREQDDATRIARTSAIDVYLKCTFPTIAPMFYPEFKTYRRAVEGVSPFTDRSKSIFAKKFTVELEARKSHIIRKQYYHFLNQIKKEFPGCSWNAYIHVQEKHSAIITSLEGFPTAEEVRALATPLVAEGVEEQRRISVRKRWMSVYGKTFRMRKALSECTIYIEADETREQELAEFVGQQVGN